VQDPRTEMRTRHKKHSPLQHSHASQDFSLLQLGDEAINAPHLVLTTSELRKYQHVL